jgi:hypothetical protein
MLSVAMRASRWSTPTLAVSGSSTAANVGAGVRARAGKRMSFATFPVVEGLLFRVFCFKSGTRSCAFTPCNQWTIMAVGSQYGSLRPVREKNN